MITTQGSSHSFIRLSTWICMCGLLGFAPMMAAAPRLIIGYGSHNAPPYALIEDEKLTGGIIKDIGSELAQLAAIDIQYQYTPRKRMDLYLQTGQIHTRLIANPAWVDNPDQYDWSQPLFEESDRFVVLTNGGIQVNHLDDLKGKRLGTILGYYYPDLSDYFDSRKIFRDDVKTLEANFQKLGMKRIDALIDSNILIAYHLKMNPTHPPFVMAPYIASTHTIHAMFSKQTPIPIDQINAAIEQLKSSGRMQMILQKYE